MGHDLYASGYFNDPAEWTTCATSESPVDILEPLPETVSAYREAALSHLQLLLVTDAFLAEAPDARLAWVSIAVTMRLHSVQGLTRAEICEQLGVSELALKQSVDQFRELAGIGAAGFRV